MIYGVGAGQMNRVGSAELALKQAAATLAEEETSRTGVPVDPKEAARKAGLVLASDAFFPFDDCVTLAAEYGVKASCSLADPSATRIPSRNATSLASPWSSLENVISNINIIFVADNCLTIK